MPSFAYRAAHSSGKIHKGRMEAANENELAFYLRQLDLELIHAESRKSFPSSPVPSARADPRETIVLCLQLEDLLRAGLPFAEALETVRATLPGGNLRAPLMAIAQSLAAGRSAYEAFAAHPRLFDPVFLAILKAGETSGDLAETFARLAAQLRAQDKAKRALRRALRYPMFLLGVVFLTASFMMGFVVPEIVSFLAGLGVELPLFTRLLIGSADLFASLWWTLPLFTIAGGMALYVGRRFSTAVAERTDGWLLKVPGLGPVLRKLALARLTSSFALLLASGLPLPLAFQTASGTLGNRFLTALAKEASARLDTGLSLSQAAASLFPPLSAQMIKVGEKSGAMDAALARIAAQNETEAREAAESFLGALEPGLTLLLGAFFAWIVLAVLGPVYGSLGPLAKGM